MSITYLPEYVENARLALDLAKKKMEHAPLPSKNKNVLMPDPTGPPVLFFEEI